MPIFVTLRACRLSLVTFDVLFPTSLSAEEVVDNEIELLLDSNSIKHAKRDFGQVNSSKNTNIIAGDIANADLRPARPFPSLAPTSAGISVIHVSPSYENISALINQFDRLVDVTGYFGLTNYILTRRELRTSKTYISQVLKVLRGESRDEWRMDSLVGYSSVI
jgi:hypothetical protein